MSCRHVSTHQARSRCRFSISESIDGRLGLHQPELADVSRGNRRGSPAPHALPVSADVLLDQVSQVLQVRSPCLRRDALDVDQLVVVAVDEVAIQVEHVGEAAREARAEVEAGAARARTTTPPVMYSQQ